MIRKILIANRGEIACRIMRTCQDLAIRTVAVYSDADAHALHVDMADEAIHIGASPPGESYLNMDKIIAAAKQTDADAIHPGYGFLAENATFARAVEDAGLIFIGPPASAIEAMGDKRQAKLMLDDIPFVPGYTGEDQTNDTLVKAAAEIGYPIMVKAAAGGGGKGMRQVESPDAMVDALEAARREAKQAFGDDTLLLEKVVTAPRHVEVQIIGDRHGNIIALGERECTIQRRHQKIIEETPSTVLTPELRKAMLDAAVRVGEQLGYYNAGTVEFLVDDAGKFYFMEMNTRLQVEHPVTEEVFGIDLVQWQIYVAEGKRLPELDLEPTGHAIEARVYAEDPSNQFLPVIGQVLKWQEPAVRTDSGICSGDRISIHYDPMIAKIIAWGATREEAIRKLDYALGNLQLIGLRNNVEFLRRIIMHPDHLSGHITTHFIQQHPELLVDETTLPAVALIAAAINKQPATTYWRNNPNRPIEHRFTYRNEEHTIHLTPHRDEVTFTAQIDEQTYIVKRRNTNETDTFKLIVNGHLQQVNVTCTAEDDWWVQTDKGVYHLQWTSPLPLPGQRIDSAGSLRAPMPGQVIQIMVTEEDEVAAGTVLLIMEAMKMEHRIEAPYDGTIQKIHYKVGDSVQQDAILLELHGKEM